MADWLITIPKTIPWEEYEKELEAVKYWNNFLSYRTPYKPKVVGSDRIFVVWDGFVRGWQKATGVVEDTSGFICQTTGKKWAPGFYIRRSGPFHLIEKMPYKGFRGIRKFEYEG